MPCLLLCMDTGVQDGAEASLEGCPMAEVSMGRGLGGRRHPKDTCGWGTPTVHSGGWGIPMGGGWGCRCSHQHQCRDGTEGHVQSG